MLNKDCLIKVIKNYAYTPQNLNIYIVFPYISGITKLIKKMMKESVVND